MVKKDVILKIAYPIPELLFRIVIGVVFIESGLGKIQNLAPVISYFESLGIPYANLQAPFVAVMELVAGFFVFFGFFTRFFSSMLAAIMVVALKTAKGEEIVDFSSLIGISEFLYLTILLWLLVHGANQFSLDHFINKKRKCVSKK